MDLNRVAPEPRPFVPKFRVPEYAVILRFVGNGLFRLLPGRPVPGVPLELHADAGQGLCLFIPEVRTRDGALLWIHGGGLISGHNRWTVVPGDCTRPCDCGCVGATPPPLPPTLTQLRLTTVTTHGCGPCETPIRSTSIRRGSLSEAKALVVDSPQPWCKGLATGVPPTRWKSR